MSKYKFLVGVTPTALETELNCADAREPLLRLHQVFLAPGTGFIAVVELPSESRETDARDRINEVDVKEPLVGTRKSDPPQRYAKKAKVQVTK
jgi:hypothetical protein